jgi:hypothetical protein
MSNDDATPTPPGAGEGDSRPPQPTEEELLAAYEAQMKQIRVEEVVVQSLASLVELGGRRAGLVPGAQDEADPAQLQLAIEAIRALMPVAGPLIGPNQAQIEQALSQLQLAFAKLTGGPAAPGEPADPAGKPAGESPVQPAPSRLWVPGQ